MKKLKPPFKFQIGKCYKVRAFDAKYLYRIEVLKLWADGAPHGNFKAYCKDTNRYSPIIKGGSFSEITEAIEIPNL